jgi:hypothetical protein
MFLVSQIKALVPQRLKDYILSLSDEESTRLLGGVHFLTLISILLMPWYIALLPTILSFSILSYYALLSVVVKPGSTLHCYKQAFVVCARDFRSFVDWNLFLLKKLRKPKS